MLNKKAGPQFTDVNEEPAYRSAVQNSPAICVFFMRRDSAYTSSHYHKDMGRWDVLSSQHVPA